jgi:L-asparaginase/Glu-tRNA(Gln) amidotransferase subunit D
VKLPASTKAATWSAVGGVVVGMVLMSYGFGYMSPSAAEKVAKTQSDAAVVAVLAPVCAAKFRELPDYAAKRAALEKASAYERRDIFPKELVTLPGKTYTDADLASACSEAVLKMKAASS